MRILDGWRWLRSIPRRGELESGLDAEIQFHVDQQTQKLVDSGLTPEAARRRALLQFGGVQPVKDAVRDEFRPARLERLWRDVRFAGRTLLRAPGFTVVAILTLALGIGATTAMFSIVDGVLLRPLPYPHPDRLVDLVHTSPQVEQMFGSPAIYFGYRDFGTVFEAVGHWDSDVSPVTVMGVSATGAAEPESVPAVAITHEVLPMLGAAPIAGRAFRAADDVPGAAPTAMVSSAYAERRLGGAGAVGRTLVVAGVPTQVIGVLPPSFRFFDDAADVYLPVQPDRTTARFPSFDGRGIARLKPGVTLAQADADAARILAILSREFSPSTPAGPGPLLRVTPRLRPLKTSIVGSMGGTLWILLGTIALLLVLACASVANLVLVRTEARRPELTLRAALGAGRAAIASIVLTESLMLGLAGGLAGLGIAAASLPLLVALGGDDLPGIMAIGIDLRVLAVTILITLLTTVLFALAPLAHMALPRLQLARSLYRGGRSTIGSREIARTRHALVVAQVAVALVLLIGAGLMIRTFVTLRQVDAGIRDPDAVLTFQVTLPQTVTAGVAPDAVSDRFLRGHRAIADRLATVAGVEAVGFGAGNDPLPLDGDGRQVSFIPFFDGRQVEDGLARVWESGSVSPGFFEAIGTPMLAGRPFDWSDLERRRAVMLVSESVARREWGSVAAALGHRIAAVPEQEPVEVVGVLADVRHDGLDQPAPPAVAMPVSGRETATFAIRSARAASAGGREAFVTDVRRAVREVDPTVALAHVRTLGSLYHRSMAQTSITLLLLAITGALAFVLGLIGVYGVVAYAASRRRSEIGLRLALGARHGDIRLMFVRQAIILVTVGVAIGLGAATVITRLIASRLFGVTPLDPVTHAVVVIALMLAAAVASYISARRGTSLDPVTVLRAD